MRERMDWWVNSIDIDKLCKLVKKKPVIWDNSIKGFKCGKSRNEAWEDIIESLIPGFRYLEKDERIDLANAVKHKWTQLRVRYPKDKALPCAYDLKFLDKVKDYKKLNSVSNKEEVLGPEDSFEPSKDESITEAPAVSLANKDEFVPKSDVPPKKTRPSKKLKHKTEPETGFSNSLDFFFQSIVPQLNRFSNAEYIEFQVGFLQVIANIYEKRKQNLPSILYPQMFLDPSIGEPQSSCSQPAESS